MPNAGTLVVAGATGAVGQAVLDTLVTRSVVWDELRLAASDRHAGQQLSAYGRDLEVHPVSPRLFDGADVAICAVPEHRAAEIVDVAVRAGVPVVDSSPVYRAAEGVPLVVPEINPAQVANRPRGIVASPSGSSTALAIALAPLHQRWGLERVVVTAMQAVSGIGEAGQRQLAVETRALIEGPDVANMTGGIRRQLADLQYGSPFPEPIAGNVIPVTSDLDADGWSMQEARMRRETRKILGAPEVAVSATTVWVPVMRSHSLSVHATFATRVDAAEARRVLIEGDNSVVVLDDVANQDWPSPIDVTGSEPTFVGRIRGSADSPRALNLFVCSDNLRKGAALNMVQIAEAIVAGADAGVERD
ncbi:aspartate-semialdehyde dehydrogenase [Dermacoccaceae bacterium W4C1]